MGDELDMVAPCGRVAFAHLEDVCHHVVDSQVRVTPDVVKQVEGVDVDQPLCR